jgi:uncharacterized protein (TIGR03067 family)
MDVRRKGLVACVAVGVAVLAAALRADEPKVEGDLKTMQGEWVSRDDMGESTWTFKGDKLSIKTPTRAYEITVTLDPKAKPEKAIDFKVGDQSPNAKGASAEGIYKFEGEKALVICFGAQDASRPTEFKTDFGKSFNFELKRK